MFRSRFGILLLAAVAATVVTGCLQHYTIYKVEPAQAGFQAAVTGQFDTGPKQVQLLRFSHFANPASKQIPGAAPTRIWQPNAHLNWYDIEQSEPEPLRTVRFKNQFGDHSVRIKDPRALLVPAEKTSDPDSAFDKNLDHYKCYALEAIFSGPDLPAVTLKDQFGTEQSVPIRKPAYFCVPVSKQLPTGALEKIKNAKNHLAIYALEPRPRDRDISTLDQFGDASLAIERLVYLAVPTEKRAVVPPPP